MRSALPVLPPNLLRLLILTLLVAIPRIAGFSQTAASFSLIGSVRDPNGQPVNAVRVSVIDENFQPIYTAFVDSGGRFTLKGIKQGRFVVRIETTGTPFQEYSQQLELQALRRLGGNEDMILDITLKYKKGEGPPAKSGTVYAQDVPKAAQKEMDRGLKNLKESHTDLAIVALKKAIEIFPDYFEALEKLGMEYIKVGQYNDAIPVLTHATEINKRASRCLYALGVANLKLSRLPEAIEWLTKSEQIESGNPNTFMMLGLAYGNSGSLDKSEAAFKKALQLGGEGSAEAHYYLTGLFNKQERYREAWQELELFLKESKSVKDTSQIKAMITNLKEKEKALAAQPAATTPGPAAPADNAPSPATVVVQPETDSAAKPTGDEAKPAATLAPLPPLPAEYVELLSQTAASGATLHKNLLDYTYQLKKVHHVLNASGNSVYTEEQIFEAYPIRGEHVLILLSRNGVKSRTVSDERKRAAKQLEEAEKLRSKEKPANAEADEQLGSYVSAGVTGTYAGKTGYVSINISTFLHSCDFFSPRVEKIGDRETVVLNYRYRPGVKLAPNHRYITNLVGTVWIDQTDKVLTRLEGWPVSAAAFDLVQSTSPKDEAALIYQQTRQADKTWTPSVIRMNSGGRTDLFDGLNWDVIFEFSNFRQFNTQAEDAKIKDPTKTP